MTTEAKMSLTFWELCSTLGNAAKPFLMGAIFVGVHFLSQGRDDAAYVLPCGDK